MRTAFILLFLVNIITAGVFWMVCPGNVAIHFSSGGQPDSWAPAWANFAVMTGVNLLMFLIFFFLPVLARVIPGKFINLPNKDYWLREENRPRYLEMLTRNFSQIGILTLLMLLAATIFAMRANLAKPPKLDETPFLLLVVLYIVCTLLWTFKFFHDFRKPKSRIDEMLSR
jgi:uncharacterized membrane protein